MAGKLLSIESSHAALNLHIKQLLAYQKAQATPEIRQKAMQIYRNEQMNDTTNTFIDSDNSQFAKTLGKTIHDSLLLKNCVSKMLDEQRWCTAQLSNIFKINEFKFSNFESKFGF